VTHLECTKHVTHLAKWAHRWAFCFDGHSDLTNVTKMNDTRVQGKQKVNPQKWSCVHAFRVWKAVTGMEPPFFSAPPPCSMQAFLIQKLQCTCKARNACESFCFMEICWARPNQIIWKTTDLAYNNTTTTVLRPFVRDYPGEPVPEETLTHPTSWSSSNLY